MAKREEMKTSIYFSETFSILLELFGQWEWQERVRKTWSNRRVEKFHPQSDDFSSATFQFFLKHEEEKINKKKL